MPRQSVRGPPAAAAACCSGRGRGGWWPASSPTHFKQMVVSQGGLALPSAEAPSNLKQRGQNEHLSGPPKATHSRSDLALSPPEGGLEKLLQKAEGTSISTLGPEIWGQSPGILVPNPAAKK